MPKPEPRWLTVVVRVALDWRFLIAVAILIRVLLKVVPTAPGASHGSRTYLYASVRRLRRRSQTAERRTVVSKVYNRRVNLLSVSIYAC